ncbi:MAG: PqqD family peptide modification chaperone [Bacteroidota bacterium]
MDGAVNYLLNEYDVDASVLQSDVDSFVDELQSLDVFID